jgi:hypothetical protein
MMKISWRSGLVAIGALALSFAPLAANAAPVVYSLADGGLDGAHICSGTSASTCPSTKTFNYAPPAGPPNAYDAATGTITLDSTAGTVAFNMNVASSTFLSIAASDNGVDEIEFTNVTYAATLTGATFTPVAGDTVISWGAQTPGGGNSVSGTYEQLLLGGNVNGPDAFVVGARVNAGTCTLTAAGHLTCGFIFGPGGTPQFTLDVGPDATPVTRRVVHSLNVVAVPEPGTAVLLILGISGIAMRGRSR